MPATTSTPDNDGVLTLCHWGPSRLAPTLSSFVLKLETYLKMAKISYKQEFTHKTSSKGKMPYIKMDGKEIPDSNFIICHLNEKFEKNLDASLSAPERAVSLAFKRLIEENLYWTLVYYRWVENFATFSKLLPGTGIRKRLFPIVSTILLKPGIKSSLNGHGIGRHTKEEICEIMEKDLRALSDFLADKQFLMGSEPTEVDASLFGFLAQALWASPGCPHEKFISDNVSNLADYTKRMRDQFWPDWEDTCLQEKKKEDDVPVEKKEKGEGDAIKDETGVDKSSDLEKTDEQNGDGSAQAQNDGKDEAKEQHPNESEKLSEEQKEEATPEK